MGRLSFPVRFRDIQADTGCIAASGFSDYNIANVVGLVDCVDREKSKLKYFDDGDIKRIRKLVLDESRISPELRILRLAKRSILTLVHQSVKEAIESEGITGCVFHRPGEYSAWWV